jgi:hypothetical protein
LPITIAPRRNALPIGLVGRDGARGEPGRVVGWSRRAFAAAHWRGPPPAA